MISERRRASLGSASWFAAMGGIAAYLVHFATAWGPWAFSDATGYLVAARNLLAGHGIGRFTPAGDFSPGVTHPPFYVLSLGLVGLFGPEPIQAARVLDMLLFGLFVGGVGYGLYRTTGRLWLGLALSGVLVLHPAVVIMFLSAMSEPPFLVTGFASLFFAAKYVHRGRTPWLLASAIAGSLALLTRYPGVVFLATGSLGVLLLMQGTPATRARAAAGHTALGIIPISLFLAWAALQPNAEAPRGLREASLGVGGLVDFFRQLAGVVWAWKPVPLDVLLPSWLQGTRVFDALFAIGVGGFIAFLASSVVRARRAKTAPEGMTARGDLARSLLAIHVLFKAAYLIFFAAVYLVSDPTPDIDSRTMLPLVPALLISLGCGSHLALNAWEDRTISQAVLAGLVLPALVGYGILSYDIYTGIRRTGLGYTGRDWRQSEVIAFIDALPDDVPIITNETEPVLLLTGRTPYPIPELAGAPPERPARFGEGASEAEERFRTQAGALVLFNSIHDDFRRLYGADAEGRLDSFTAGLALAFEAEDGKVYFWPD